MGEQQSVRIATSSRSRRRPRDREARRVEPLRPDPASCAAPSTRRINVNKEGIGKVERERSAEPTGSERSRSPDRVGGESPPAHGWTVTLLSESHPENSSRAGGALRAVIRLHEIVLRYGQLVDVIETFYGSKYILEGDLRCAARTRG